MALHSDDSTTGIPAGVKLCAPAVILAYCILGNPWLGLILYGRNVAHRGQRAMGGVISILAALVLALIFIAEIDTPRQRFFLPLFLLSILLGIGVYRLESGPYRRARAEGAARARWWPPLILMLAILFLFSITINK
jgi:hypothetical protein